MNPARLKCCMTVVSACVALAAAPLDPASARSGRAGSVVTSTAKERSDPKTRIVRANEAARVQPERGGYFNAIQQYAWAEGALFQIYTSPGQVTDIVLEEGEQLVGPGPVASGDTVRWIIGDTVSGSGAARKVHILVKPTRADITTNLIINTDRRTYHLELRATNSTYMASVSWSYPADSLIALKGKEGAITVAGGMDLAALNFHYRLSGDKPSWRPVRIFDDGRQVFVEFGPDIGVGEMPPLFVSAPDGSAELVNYRVLGRFLVVDRIFNSAELRLGAGKSVKRVRIERAAAKGQGKS